MPVQNSNSKMSANLLYILIPTASNRLLCQKGHFTLQVCPRRYVFFPNTFGHYPQTVKIENSLWKFLPVQKGGFQENACP